MTQRPIVIPLVSFILAQAAFADVRFVDVTKGAGVEGIRDFGAHAAAVADVNGDGFDDIYVTNCGNRRMGGAYLAQPNLLYLNNGDGTFREAAKHAGVQGIWGEADDLSHGAIFADLDCDGDLDLVIGCGSYDYPNRVFRNDGKGSFTDVTEACGMGLTRYGTRAVCAGDIDGDGTVDVYVSNAMDGAYEHKGPPQRVINLYLNDGKGRLTPRAGPPFTGFTQGAVMCDLNEDGHLDILEAKWGGADHGGIAFSVYLGDGKGGFRDAASDLGVDPTRGRYNGVEVGDYDNDGFLDVVVLGDDLRLYHNEGGRKLRDVTGEHGLSGRGFSATFGDVDNDGWLDLFVANTSGRPFALYHNTRGKLSLLRGTGAEIEDRGASSSRGAALLDFDRDGRLDIFVARKRDANVLLRNESDVGNWLGVRLTGPLGDAAAYGAKVWLYEIGHMGDAQFLRGYQQSINSRAYVTQCSPVMRFGLGAADGADLRIRFTTGKVVELRGVKAGRIVHVDGRK